MAEDTNQDAAGAKTGEAEFKPITSQEEFERALGKRLQHERAKFSDYEQLQQKAAEFDKIQQANQSETERLAQQLREAQERADRAERDRIRAEVAADKGVPATSLTGTTREELEASADTLLSWRDQAARSGSLNPRGGFFSGATPSDDKPLDPKARAAAAMRQLGRNH